jgi:hypothetical protein
MIGAIERIQQYTRGLDRELMSSPAKSSPTPTSPVTSSAST